jgi:hypothetical protein
MDLFDYKPRLNDMRGVDLPDSIRRGQRLTGMTATQDRFPIAPSKYRFRQHGRSGATISELMPHLAGVADELCFIKSMQTGRSITTRPSPSSKGGGLRAAPAWAGSPTDWGARIAICPPSWS